MQREEESEINMLKRFNNSLSKRADSSNFLSRGGFFHINKRPNSIGGFNSPTFKGYHPQSNYTGSPTAMGHGGTENNPNHDVQMEDLTSNHTSHTTDY